MSDKVELSTEEIQALKEIAKDRMAISRVSGKLKNTALLIGGLLATYFLVVENVVKWIKYQIGMT